jgi:hypothetical protein
MTAVHMGKLSLYTERQTTMRKLQHFAG